MSHDRTADVWGVGNPAIGAAWSCSVRLLRAKSALRFLFNAMVPRPEKGLIARHCRDAPPWQRLYYRSVRAVGQFRVRSTIGVQGHVKIFCSMQLSFSTSERLSLDRERNGSFSTCSPNTGRSAFGPVPVISRERMIALKNGWQRPRQALPTGGVDQRPISERNPESGYQIALAPHGEVGSPFVVVQVKADAVPEIRKRLAEGHEIPTLRRHQWGV